MTYLAEYKVQGLRLPGRELRGGKQRGGQGGQGRVKGRGGGHTGAEDDFG